MGAGGFSSLAPKFYVIYLGIQRFSSRFSFTHYDIHLSIHTHADSRFTDIGQPNRIWTISAIHGDIDRLVDLHDTIFPHIKAGDRVLYTGNYIGYGAASHDVLTEILAFRRGTLAKPSMIASDFIYLRGGQEEMLQKLLQLQFAPAPLDAYLWMIGNGLSNTLYAYGLSPHDGIDACKQGIVGISQWTNHVRATMRQYAGHEKLTTQLVRAAYTSQNTPYSMLFVNAGIDHSKAIGEQGDNFWWAGQKFDAIDQAYAPYEKVIRGYDPYHKGMHYNCVKATIDGGCGFGGSLVCSVFSAHGEVLDTLEV